MTPRLMKIVRNPGSSDTPCLKIANRILEANGFVIGTPIRVSYGRDVVIITKQSDENENCLLLQA